MKYTHYFYTGTNYMIETTGTDLKKLINNIRINGLLEEGSYRQVIKDSHGKVIYDVGPDGKMNLDRSGPILNDVAQAEKRSALALSKLNAKIKADNAAFNKLPKREQRIMVAKDVLKWLNTSKLKAVHQSYIMLKMKPGNKLKEDTDDGDVSLQDVLLNKVESCTVCAKGAIFACTVARRNQVTVDDSDNVEFDNGQEVSKLLGGVFSPAQLRLIEVEFEREDMEYINQGYVGRNLLKEITPVMDNILHLDAKGRMVRIMRNIIKNDGTFKPELG